MGLYTHRSVSAAEQTQTV